MLVALALLIEDVGMALDELLEELADELLVAESLVELL